MTSTSKFAPSGDAPKAKCLKDPFISFLYLLYPIYLSLYKLSGKKRPTALKSAAIQPQGLKRVRTDRNGLVWTGCAEKIPASSAGSMYLLYGAFAHD